jgi:hypothetical protein
MLQKHCVSHFLNAIEYRLQLPSGCQDTVSKRHSFRFIFNLLTKQNHRGLSPASREDGNDNHVVVSQKLCGFQGRADGRIVVLKEKCGACSYFLFTSGTLHN